MKGCQVNCTDSVVHLGHKLFSNPRQDDLESIVRNFNRQFNMFRAKFQCIPAQVKNTLFVAYCTTLYGIQLYDLQKGHKLHVAYRKSIRTLWGLPYRTHCSLLPCITKSNCSVHMCIKRFIKFANSVLQHEFPVVRYIFKVALSHSNSVFTRNLHYAGNLCGLNTAYLVNLDVAELSHIVNRGCEANCHTQEDTVTGTAIRDLVLVSQEQLFSIMDRQDALQFLNFLCTTFFFGFSLY